ncbi:unnamed protein product [Amoebophrya sp. A120]|nr:unnamed protein product [Amoebophrya sp. A120]|eukprot:GSA120T00007577001.1
MKGRPNKETDKNLLTMNSEAAAAAGATASAGKTTNTNASSTSSCPASFLAGDKTAAAVDEGGRGGQRKAQFVREEQEEEDHVLYQGIKSETSTKAESSEGNRLRNVWHWPLGNGFSLAGGSRWILSIFSSLCRSQQRSLKGAGGTRGTSVTASGRRMGAESKTPVAEMEFFPSCKSVRRRSGEAGERKPQERRRGSRMKSMDTAKNKYENGMKNMKKRELPAWRKRDLALLRLLSTFRSRFLKPFLSIIAPLLSLLLVADLATGYRSVSELVRGRSGDRTGNKRAEMDADGIVNADQEWEESFAFLENQNPQKYQFHRGPVRINTGAGGSATPAPPGAVERSGAAGGASRSTTTSETSSSVATSSSTSSVAQVSQSRLVSSGSATSSAGKDDKIMTTGGGTRTWTATDGNKMKDQETTVGSPATRNNVKPTYYLADGSLSEDALLMGSTAPEGSSTTSSAAGQEYGANTLRAGGTTSDWHERERKRNKGQEKEQGQTQGSQNQKDEFPDVDKATASSTGRGSVTELQAAYRNDETNGADVVKKHFKEVTHPDDACDADKFAQKYDDLMGKWKKKPGTLNPEDAGTKSALADNFDEMQLLIAKKACRVAGCKVCGSANAKVQWECISPGPEDYCAPVLPKKHQQLFKQKLMQPLIAPPSSKSKHNGGISNEELSTRRTCLNFARESGRGEEETTYSGGRGTVFEHVQFMCPDQEIPRPPWENIPEDKETEGSKKNVVTSSLFALSMICIPKLQSEAEPYIRRIRAAIEMPTFERSTGAGNAGEATDAVQPDPYKQEHFLDPGCQTARHRAELAYPNEKQKTERLYATCMLALDGSTANYPSSAAVPSLGEQKHERYGYGFFLSTLIDNGGLQLAFVNLFREFIAQKDGYNWRANDAKFDFIMNADAKLSMLRHPKTPDCRGKTGSTSTELLALAECVMTPAFKTHVANSLRQFTDALLLTKGATPVNADLSDLVTSRGTTYYVDLARHGIRVKIPFAEAESFISPYWKAETAEKLSKLATSSESAASTGISKSLSLYYIGGGNVFDLMAEVREEALQKYFADILEQWRAKNILLAGQSAGSMVQNQDNSFLMFGLSGDPAPHHIYKESPYAFSKDGNFAGNCIGDPEEEKEDKKSDLDWPQLITPTSTGECDPVRDADEKKGEWVKDRPLVPPRSEGQHFESWWNPSRNTAANIDFFKVSELQRESLGAKAPAAGDAGPEPAGLIRLGEQGGVDLPKCGTRGTSFNSEWALKGCASYSYSCHDLREKGVGGVSDKFYRACEQDTGLLDPEAKGYLGQPKTSSWVYMHVDGDTGSEDSQEEAVALTIKKNIAALMPMVDRAVFVYRVILAEAAGHVENGSPTSVQPMGVGIELVPRAFLTEVPSDSPKPEPVKHIRVEGDEAQWLKTKLSGQERPSTVYVAFFCAHDSASPKYNECAKAKRSRRGDRPGELRVRGSKLLRDPDARNGDEDAHPDLVPFSRNIIEAAANRVDQQEETKIKVEVAGGVTVALSGASVGAGALGMYQGLRGLGPGISIRPHVCSATGPKPVFESLMYGTFLVQNTETEMIAITDGMAVVTTPGGEVRGTTDRDPFDGLSRAILGDAEFLLVRGEGPAEKSTKLMSSTSWGFSNKGKEEGGAELFKAHSRSVTGPDDACDADKFAQTYDRFRKAYTQQPGGSSDDNEMVLKIAKKACRVAGCKVCGTTTEGKKESWQCVSPGPEDYCAPVLTASQKGAFPNEAATQQPHSGTGKQAEITHQATCKMYAQGFAKTQEEREYTYLGGDGSVFEAMEFMCPEKPAQTPKSSSEALGSSSLFALSVVCIPTGGKKQDVEDRVWRLIQDANVVSPDGGVQGSAGTANNGQGPGPEQKQGALVAGCLPAGKRAALAYPDSSHVAQRAYVTCILALEASMSSSAGQPREQQSQAGSASYGYGFFLSTLIDNGGLQLAFVNLFREFVSKGGGGGTNGKAPFTFIMNADAKLSMLRNPEACRGEVDEDEMGTTESTLELETKTQAAAEEEKEQEQEAKKFQPPYEFVECLMTPSFRAHVANSLRQFTDSLRQVPEYKKIAHDSVFYVDLVRHKLRVRVPSPHSDGENFINLSWKIDADEPDMVQKIPHDTDHEDAVPQGELINRLFPKEGDAKTMYYIGGGNVFDVMAEVRDAPSYFSKILRLWREKKLLLAGQSAGSMVQNQDNSFLFFGLSGDPAPHHIYGPTYAFSKDGNFAGDCLVPGSTDSQGSDVEYPQLITTTDYGECGPSRDSDINKAEWIKDRPLVPSRSHGQDYEAWWLPSQTTAARIEHFKVSDLQKRAGSVSPSGAQKPALPSGAGDKCGADGWFAQEGKTKSTKVALPCASFSYSCPDLQARGVGGVSHSFFPACTLDTGLLDPRAQGYLGQPKTASWVYIVANEEEAKAGLGQGPQKTLHKALGDAIRDKMQIVDKEITVYQVTVDRESKDATTGKGSGSISSPPGTVTQRHTRLKLQRVYPASEGPKTAGPKEIAEVVVADEEAKLLKEKASGEGSGAPGGGGSGSLVLVAFFCPHDPKSNEFAECKVAKRVVRADGDLRPRGSKLLRDPKAENDDTGYQDNKRPDLVPFSRQTIKEAVDSLAAQNLGYAIQVKGGVVAPPPPSEENANLERLIENKEALIKQGEGQNGETVAKHLGMYQGLRGIAPFSIRPHVCSATGVKPIFLSEMYDAFILYNTRLGILAITDGTAVITFPHDDQPSGHYFYSNFPGRWRVILGDGYEKAKRIGRCSSALCFKVIIIDPRTHILAFQQCAVSETAFAATIFFS